MSLLRDGFSILLSPAFLSASATALLASPHRATARALLLFILVPGITTLYPISDAAHTQDASTFHIAAKQ